MRRLAAILLALVLLLEMVAEGQQQQQRAGRNLFKRPTKKKRIECPICASDFMSKRVTIDDPCFNPRYNLTVADQELISQCPAAMRSCVTETVYVNGVLTSIKRKCGLEENCTETCLVAGLGLTSRTCSKCCPPFDFNSVKPQKDRECA